MNEMDIAVNGPRIQQRRGRRKKDSPILLQCGKKEVNSIETLNSDERKGLLLAQYQRMTDDEMIKA